MPISELNILLSCHSLDDFPTYHTGEPAEGILSAFTALWHPALMAEVGKLPTWIRSDDPPEQLADRLITVPQVVHDDMPGFFFSQAESDGAKLITGLNDRAKIVAAALEHTAASRDGAQVGNITVIEPSLAADFFALGFCYLQTEVLTRRMRYMSNLDEVAFERATLAAARAATEGNADEARTQLTSAFNYLLESRGYFYPVDTYLLDLTLIAPSTMGAELRDELAQGAAMNVLVSASTLERMAQEQPDTLAALRAAVEAGTVAIIGGEAHEPDLSLLSHEAILSSLQAAGAIYDRLLGRRPAVFGRWRSGLTPVLPQVLHDCGFVGALHFTLDGAGRFPVSERIKTAWSGLDGTGINSITKPPLDARQPETFLSLSDTLGDTMDHDFVATVMFAHWPGAASPFYDDLRRAAKYAAVLGKFATLNEYFTDTESAGTSSKFSPDQYRTPHLRPGETDAIASQVDSSQSEAQRTAADTIAFMTSALRGSSTAPHQEILEPLAALQSAASDFAAAWQGSIKQSADKSSGYLLVNPLNFSRRIGIELPQLASAPHAESPVIAADSSSGTVRAVVEVPSLGFSWITAASSPAPAPKSRKQVPSTIVTTEGTLRNEYCEVKVHPHTGGIQSIHDFRTRGNRLSQQLAIRLASPNTHWRQPSEPVYTVMAVDSIATVQNDTTVGKVVSRGRLMDPSGKVLAQYAQTVTLWRGSRTLELEIELISLFAEFASDAWSSYLASRLAWNGSMADLRRDVHGCSVVTESRRLVAPQFVEIVDGSARTAILTGGLAYHRRSGDRMLDTILKVQGESSTMFRLGIGIDVPHVWRAAQEFVVPPTCVFLDSQPQPPVASSWLFHTDAPNVKATYWQPLVEAGQVVGFRVRLLETEARRGQVRASCFRALTSAERLDVAGRPRGGLAIENGAAVCEIGPYEWIQIEARW